MRAVASAISGSRPTAVVNFDGVQKEKPAGPQTACLPNSCPEALEEGRRQSKSRKMISTLKRAGTGLSALNWLSGKSEGSKHALKEECRQLEMELCETRALLQSSDDAFSRMTAELAEKTEKLESTQIELANVSKLIHSNNHWLSQDKQRRDAENEAASQEIKCLKHKYEQVKGELSLSEAELAKEREAAMHKELVVKCMYHKMLDRCTKLCERIALVYVDDFLSRCPRSLLDNDAAAEFMDRFRLAHREADTFQHFCAELVRNPCATEEDLAALKWSSLADKWQSGEKPPSVGEQSQVASGAASRSSSASGEKQRNEQHRHKRHSRDHSSPTKEVVHKEGRRRHSRTPKMQQPAGEAGFPSPTASQTLEHWRGSTFRCSVDSAATMDEALWQAKRASVASVASVEEAPELLESTESKRRHHRGHKAKHRGSHDASGLACPDCPGDSGHRKHTSKRPKEKKHGHSRRPSRGPHEAAGSVVRNADEHMLGPHNDLDEPGDRKTHEGLLGSHHEQDDGVDHHVHVTLPGANQEPDDVWHCMTPELVQEASREPEDAGDHGALQRVPGAAHVVVHNRTNGPAPTVHRGLADARDDNTHEPVPKADRESDNAPHRTHEPVSAEQKEGDDGGNHGSSESVSTAPPGSRDSMSDKTESGIHHKPVDVGVVSTEEFVSA